MADLWCTTLPRRKALISSAEDVFSRLSLSLLLPFLGLLPWSALLLVAAALQSRKVQELVAGLKHVSSNMPQKPYYLSVETLDMAGCCLA